jgi:hypothetical protein
MKKELRRSQYTTAVQNLEKAHEKQIKVFREFNAALNAMVREAKEREKKNYKFQREDSRAAATV